MNAETLKLLSGLEERFDAIDALTRFGDMPIEGAYHMEVCVRTMFLALDRLVEGNDSEAERVDLSNRLVAMFSRSFAHYRRNPEYLSLVGMMITRGEWLFGKTFEEGVEMMEIAVSCAPNDPLVLAIYVIFSDQRLDFCPERKKLCLSALFGNETEMTRLARFGLLGTYIRGIFESTYEILNQ